MRFELLVIENSRPDAAMVRLGGSLTLAGTFACHWQPSAA